MFLALHGEGRRHYNDRMKKILFICGSLRRDSYNLQLLEMAEARLSDSDCSFLDYSDIPLFSQDAEFPPPKSVSRVRALVSGSDALWVGSPEYNHSFSGALKNLMDWLSRPVVPGDYFMDWLSRPVVPGDYSTAVIRGKTVAMSSVAGSSAGSFSLASLTELITMLSCKIVPCDTRISLGSRFAEKTLVLTGEEELMLERECVQLRSML